MALACARPLWAKSSVSEKSTASNPGQRVASWHDEHQFVAPARDGFEVFGAHCARHDADVGLTVDVDDRTHRVLAQPLAKVNVDVRVQA